MRRIAALLWCLSIAMVGCAGTSDQPFDGHLRVALTPTGNMLPVYAAKTLGIFERHGLHVEDSESQDLPTMMAALANNQYDLAMTVPTLAFVGAEKGLDIKVVCSMQRSTAAEPNSVWISKDPELDQVSELRGKSIGVPSLTGILTDSMLYLLDRAGIARSDVTLVQMPFATMGDQLAAGRVDAVIAAIPFGSGLVSKGFTAHEDVVVAAVELASGGAVKTGTTALFITRGAFARDEPEALVQWRDALGEAIDYLRAHPERARSMLQTWLKLPAVVAQHAPLPTWTTAITAADLEPYVTIAKAVGTVRGNVDVDAVMFHAP